MHPIAHKYFGDKGIAVTFNNGTATVTGYILRQIGTSRYRVTDGTTTLDAVTAKTLADATSLPVGMMTIMLGSEHVAVLYSKQAITVEGNERMWSLGASVDGSTPLASFS